MLFRSEGKFNFAVQHHVIKIDIDEILCRFFVKFPFGTARQTFRNTRVTGVFVLHPVAGGHAVIPATVPGQRVVLAIQTVGFLVNQTLTLGTEWNQQRMKDLSSNTQALTGTNTGGAIDGVSTTDRSPYSKAEIFSLFAENNMELTDSTIVTPGLRFDHHSIVGNNWSPALNISQGLGDDFTLKMGIARAYKAPSLYQTNPNYILYSKGQGCYASAGGCYLQGNDDLKAETSINKEIGLEFKRDGWLAGVTWFRNDYRNKIEAGYVAVGQNAVGTDLYQWDNVPKAVVEGLEGSLNVPVSETVMWTNNITYMLKSENKTTGDRLSIIPEYTLNSTLSWQAREDLSMQTTFTWYGKQQPKKYNYKGQPAVGPETKEISPYSIVGLSATWDVTKNVSLTGGVDNLFDKRLWRAGNAQTTGDPGHSRTAVRAGLRCPLQTHSRLAG